MAHALDFGAGGFAGDVAGGPGGAIGRGDFAVEAQRDFLGDEWKTGDDVFGECVIEGAGRVLADAEVNNDAGVVELAQAAAGYARVGVLGGDDDACDSCGDEGIGAGAGTVLVGTGLECDVDGAATGATACFFEGNDFGVVFEVVFVEARADCG